MGGGGGGLSMAIDFFCFLDGHGVMDYEEM